MDHTTQTKTEFIDAIETPREELADSQAENLAPSIEAVLQEASEEKEDTAKRRAIQLAVATTKAVKRNKRRTSSPQVDAKQAVARPQEGEGEQASAAEAQAVVAVNEPELVASEIKQADVVEENAAGEPGKVAEQPLETVKPDAFAEITNAEQSAAEDDDVSTPTGKLGEIEAAPIVAEQVAIDAASVAVEQNEAPNEENEGTIPTTKLSEIDTPPVDAEQSEVAPIATAVVEQAEAVEIAADTSVAEQADAPKEEVVEAGAEQDKAVEVEVVETGAEQAEITDAAEVETIELETVEVVANVAEEEGEASIPTGKLADLRAPAVETSESADTVAEEDEVAEMDTLELARAEVQADWRRRIAATRTLKTPTHSLSEESRYRVTGSQVAIKHSVRRRWGRQNRQKKHQRWVKILSAAVVASILVTLSIPLIVGLMGYATYNNIKSTASDGISHLMAVKELVPTNKNDVTSVLKPEKLAKAQDDLIKAQNDFLQLQDIVNRPDIQSLTQQWAPQYTSKIGMARDLVTVALDVSHMGQELIGVAQMGSNVLNGGALLSSSNKPLISADDINAVEAALVHGQYYINDISMHMAQVNLDQLPFGTPSQKTQLSKALSLLPQAQDMITQVQSLIGPVSWLLGVGQPRRFLVQTLDRGELRPSGGFEGQYGVLTIQDGRISPLGLRDVAQLDYNGDGYDIGNHAPGQYKWMDFGNFGVRDANLSADYPWDARFIMDLFQKEGGGPVDGDIQFTPVLIEQMLQITGPVQVPEYHETITAQNLEDKLHAYQQDYRLIGKEAQVTGTNSHDTRKAFTSEVGQLLLDRVKHLKMNQLMDLSKVLFKDLKSRDLQVYFTNPLVEQWLTKNSDDGAMPKFTNGTDGFMVVQANISISKAAQFVHSTFNDQVTLDAQGGATHNLTITLKYDQKGPVYGYNSYADYIRVYAPANAQYLSGTGFNTGQVLCTPNLPKPKPDPNPNPNPNPNPKPNPNPNPAPGPTGISDPNGSYTDAGMPISGCGSFYHSYPDSDQRSCPDNNYELGYNGMQAKAWPIQKLGAPKNFSSDLPGYTMWGDMTLTPKNCTSTITLSWYVPNVVQHTPGQAPYQMIVGHQAGWPVTAQVNINADALHDKDAKSFSYDQTINVDTLVALPARPLPPAPKPTTPTPAVTPTGTTKKP